LIALYFHYLNFLLILVALIINPLVDHFHF
jgi:hypothetical protein